MRRLTCVLIYIHLIYANSAMAQPKLPIVFVQSNDVSNAEFSAFVKNASNAVSLSNYVVDSSPTKQDKKHLLNLLENAQREYLEGSIEKTRLALESLTKISRDADWPIEERKSIFYAYMRLAHLASNEDDRRKWLIEAVRFDYEISPEQKIFPPPLCKEFEQLRKSELAISKDWNVSGFKENVIAIKVNGKKYSAQYGGNIKIMNGLNRVVLISNMGLPIKQKLNVNQILALTIATNYFTIGSCSNPLAESMAKELSVKSAFYFSEDCILTSENGKWQQQNYEKYIALATHTASPIVDLNANVIERKVEVFNDQVVEDKKSDSNKKYWLIGLVVTSVAAAIALSSRNSSDESSPSKQPTHQ